MHEIGGQMKEAPQSRAADAMTGPGQGSGEGGRHERDGDFEEASASRLSS